MINVTLKDFGQRPIGRASILVDRTRVKQLFHTSQNRPSCCAFYWVTTFSLENRVSGWPRGRNVGGVTGELRRLGLIISFERLSSNKYWFLHHIGLENREDTPEGMREPVPVSQAMGGSAEQLHFPENDLEYDVDSSDEDLDGMEVRVGCRV